MTPPLASGTVVGMPSTRRTLARPLPFASGKVVGMPSTRRTLRGVRPPRTIDTKRADGSRLFRLVVLSGLIQNLETHELKAALRVYRRWMRTSPRTTPERKRVSTRRQSPAHRESGHCNGGGV